MSSRRLQKRLCTMHNADMGRSSALDELSPTTRGALRHDVMVQLLRAIFQGTLPAGTRLIIMKLAEQFGTSSTPCREALVELASVGVVEFMHNRGAVVTPFGPSELREIYQLRRILETEATRGACGRIDQLRLESLHQEIRELVQSQDSDHWSQRETASDQRLHELIADQCSSVRLVNEIHRYDLLVQTVREIIGYDPQAQQMATIEHLAILEALLLNDPEAAANAMAHHVQSAAQIAEAALFDGK